MKATLSFQLPEENEEFGYATKGVLYSIVIHDLDQYLRGKLKYETLTDEQYKIYDEIRSKLHELVNDRGVAE